MNTVTTRRWTDDQGKVWFAARVIDGRYEPPLDLLRVVNERRGLTHRVEMIDALAS